MAEVAMAKDRTSKGKDASVVGEKAKTEYTTFRIHAADGENLSELASLEGTTIAELYRELCAPLVRKRLIAKAKERLEKLEGQT